ncbi:MAG: RidA family protein, partial [Pseudomonadota bacterium]
GGFVSSMPEFYDHPFVINGASDLMAEVFGASRAKHSRFAVGVSSLPNNASVEVEAILAVD